MTGNNEIKLNKATVIQAIEYWMRQKLFQASVGFKITDFAKDAQGYVNEVYIVTTEAVEKPVIEKDTP